MMALSSAKIDFIAFAFNFVFADCLNFTLKKNINCLLL